MRVAFVDLLFSWPPHGGADVDLYHVLEGLRDEGVDARLFFAATESDDRGIAEPGTLPFPAERLDFGARAYTPINVTGRFVDALSAWEPDVVVAAHAFTMKPFLLQGLVQYPLVSRYYAHEALCARDPYRFKEGRPCPRDYVRTPEVCRTCAAEGQRAAIQTGRHRAWTEDYLAAEAYRPEYYREAMRGLRAADALVVYNEQMAEELSAFHEHVVVIPGGVDVARFDAQPPPPKERLQVLMAGRVDDPLKGAATVREALEHLRNTRQDFELVLTHHDHGLENDWIRCTGWLTFEETLELYRVADICVAPSVWHEPFGLVAVESMAAARPVVASRIGGLRDSVVDRVTGLHAAPGDVADWAEKLDRLLSDAAARAEYGRAGRARAEQDYDWTAVVRKHYLPLLEELLG